MKKIKLAGIGCGGRTRTYLSLAKERMSEYFDVVAAADPLIERAEWLKEYSTVDDFKIFNSDKALLAEDKLADVVIIGTQDDYHVEPCLEAVAKGSKATDNEVREWLKVSPWGRCVFGGCDNNVPDHQTAQFEFEKGKTATFTVTAFDTGKNIEIYGTKGSLKGGHMLKHQADTGADIIVMDHFTGNKTIHKVNINAGGYDGHGGGDHGLVSNLYNEMTKENPDDMASSISQSIESHIMGFAAEESRMTGKTIITENFLKNL